jgi:effector-binding domain-containing protein
VITDVRGEEWKLRVSVKLIKMINSNRSDPSECEKGGILTHNIIFKNTTDSLIAYLSGSQEHIDSEMYFTTLRNSLKQIATGYPFCIFTRRRRSDGLDIEFCYEVKREVKHPPLKFRMLPGGCMLSLLHTGSGRRLGVSWGVLFDYVEVNNLKIGQWRRETYLCGALKRYSDNEIELQVPVFRDIMKQNNYQLKLAERS